MTFLSDNSSLYFYSALLQANAAIFSIVAIFVIFKIQSLNSYIDARRNSLFNMVGRYISAHEITAFENIGTEEKEAWIDKKYESRTTLATPHYKAWFSYAIEIKAAKQAIVFPSIVLGSSIIFFAINILFANYMHNRATEYEVPLMIISIIIEIFCMIIVIQRIFTLLRLKKEE